MYLSHFGLDQAPFALTPNPHFFYTGNKRGAILDALIYAVTHGEGIIKVTGEVGSGKTMLCRILDSMLPRNIEVIYLVNPTLSRDEVVYAIAGELGLETRGLRADEVIRLLQSDLIAKHAAGKQVVLLVEEAQAMPLDTLEEIRLFSNLETAHHKLLQIVLFGQPELDENLKLPRMRQLKERITHSFQVPPLTPEAIPEFLMFRMRAAGYHGPDIFTKRALKLMVSVSEGITRRISVLADKSLLAAFADNTHTILAKHVKAAIDDSEFSRVRRLRSRNIIAIVALIGLMALGSWLVTGKKNPSGSHQPAVVNHVPQAVADPANLRPSSTSPDVASTNAAATAFDHAAFDQKNPIESTPDNHVLTSIAPPSVTQPSAPASSVIAISVNPLSRQVLTESKSWLATQPPQYFSLQIALIEADAMQVERYLRKIQGEVDLQEIHVYPTRIGEKVRYGVLYGGFGNRTAAIQMQKQLSVVHNYQPQLRTVSGIKTEIERAGSTNLWPGGAI